MAKRIHIQVNDGKRVSMLKKARAPQSTYNDFWNKPLTLGKKKKMKIVEPEIHDETVVARERHKDTYINDTKALVKTRAKISIKVEGKRNKRVNGWKIKVKASSGVKSSEFFKQRPGEPLFTHTKEDGTLATGYRERIESYKNQFQRHEEKNEKYEQRLNLGFTSKKKYGRFTKNPREPRSLMVVEQLRAKEREIQILFKEMRISNNEDKEKLQLQIRKLINDKRDIHSKSEGE